MPDRPTDSTSSLRAVGDARPPDVFAREAYARAHDVRAGHALAEGVRAERAAAEGVIGTRVGRSSGRLQRFWVDWQSGREAVLKLEFVLDNGDPAIVALALDDLDQISAAIRREVGTDKEG